MDNVVFIVYIPKDRIDAFFKLFEDNYDVLEAKRQQLIRLPNMSDKWGGLHPTLVKVDGDEWYQIKFNCLKDYPIVRITLENILSVFAFHDVASKLETVSIGANGKETTLEILHYVPQEELGVEIKCPPDSPWLDTYEMGYRIQFKASMLPQFYAVHDLANCFFPVGTVDDAVVLEYYSQRHPAVARVINKIIYKMLVDTTDAVLLTVFLQDKTILESSVYEFEPGLGVTISSIYSHVPAIEQPIFLLD